VLKFKVTNLVTKWTSAQSCNLLKQSTKLSKLFLLSNSTLVCTGKLFTDVIYFVSYYGSVFVVARALHPLHALHTFDMGLTSAETQKL
jgi:hypothetical protein